jgi:two-component sensor histidine kinase
MPWRNGRLVVLPGLLVLAMVALAALAVLEACAAARNRLRSEMLDTSRDLARSLDHEARRVEALLLGLATSPALDPLDQPVFQAQARRVLKEFGAGGGMILLAGPDGRQVAGTAAAAPGEPTAGPWVPVGLERVFATGRTAFGPLDEGGPAAEFPLGVTVPVRRPGEGAVAWALGAALPRAWLATADAPPGRMRLPAGWAVSVLDRHDNTLASSGVEAPDPAEAIRAATHQDAASGVGEPPARLLRLGTGPWAAVAIARIPASGHAVVVGAPAAAFGAARRAALLRTGPVALLLVLTGLGLAVLLARRAPAHRVAAPEPGSAIQYGARAADAIAFRLAAGAVERDRAAAMLREQVEWLEASQDAAHVGAWELDPGTGRMRWSAQQFRLHCLEPTKLGIIEEARWQAALDPEDLPGLQAARAAALEGGRFEAEYRVRCGDGGLRWLASRAVLERDARGRPQRLRGVSIDITRRRAIEDSREQQLRMKDLVVTEVHHRVKNSLQLMHGVLLMQARGAGPEAAAGLREAVGRVLTIAAVHRRLYEEEDARQGTELAAYLSGLVEDLRGSLLGGVPGAEIRLEIQPGLRLAASLLAPLGLVATELVTNALKYGAAPVVVRCRRGPDGLELTVEDAGPGFPPGFDPARARGLGTRLSLALARHHHGRLEIDRSAPGGRVVLVLPEAPGSAAPG